jgi:hypothetical protein
MKARGDHVIVARPLMPSDFRKLALAVPPAPMPDMVILLPAFSQRHSGGS